MVWNAVAGIAGAIGSLFGRDDEGTETVQSTVNYRAMVRAAQKAGINPLTALRNGGAAGFASTTTTSPALASENLLGRISQATGLVAEGLSNQERWERSKVREDLENQMIAAQIQNLRSAPTGAGPRGVTPRVGGIGGSSGGMSVTDSAGNTIPVEEKAPSRQLLRQIETDPAQDDTAAFEERYGDVAGSVIGIGILARDIWHATREWRTEMYDAAQDALNETKTQMWPESDTNRRAPMQPGQSKPNPFLESARESEGGPPAYRTGPKVPTKPWTPKTGRPSLLPRY